MQSFKKALSVWLTGSLIATSAFGATGQANAAAAGEPEAEVEAEWADVQSLLSGIKGVWTNQGYDGAITDTMPNTALLGNGDLGVTSGGGEGYKTFYISKGDFWNGNPGPSLAALGGITIKPLNNQASLNLARGATAAASAQHEQLGPARTVNGAWTTGYEGWVTPVVSPWAPQWIALDLGEAKKISRYVLKHDAAARAGQAINNTKSFTVQTSANGTDWTDVDTVSGNEAGITDRNIAAVTARHIRFVITEPNQGTTSDARNNPRARIGQIELYAEPSNPNVAKGAVASASGQHDQLGPARAVSGAWASGYEGWVTPVVSPWTSQWIAVDLGQEQPISRYVLKHDSAARSGQEGNNTKSFDVQVSLNGTDWTTIDEVTDNSAGETERNIETVQARHVRFLIKEPNQGSSGDAIQNPRARIGQIELYAHPKTGDEPPSLPSYDFREEQNILRAEIDTNVNLDGGYVDMKTWVAANDNVVVTDMTLREDQAPITLEVSTWTGSVKARGSYSSASGVQDGLQWATRSTAAGSNYWVSRAALATKLIGGTIVEAPSASGDTAVTTIRLEPGDRVRIATAVGGGGPNPTNHLEEALAKAGGLNEAELEALYAEHEDWWKSYWLQSYVKLSDPVLERYYYSSLYFMGSSSRADKVAPGLYGVWATSDSPFWGSDMHLNYNFMGPFYGVYSSNRTELALPYFDLILDYVPEAQRRAREDLRRINPEYIDQRFPDGGVPEGVLFPVGIGPYGSTTDDQYHKQVVNSLFSVSQFITYYEYTQDDAFLAERAYPFMKEVAAFFDHYLEWNEEKGQYDIYTGHNEGVWSRNSSPDLGLLKYLLSSLLEASESLGEDADKRERWTYMLEHLPAQPTTVHNGKTVYSLADPGTTVQTNDTRDIRPGDNTVNLEFIHPGEVLGIFSSAEERQIAIDTLDAMNSWGNDNSFPKVFSQAVRVGYPAQSLIDKLKGQITQKSAPNLRIYDPYHGIEKAGAIEAVNGMLLQSHQGVMKLFPSWPEDKDASFVRLREKGGFIVSADRIGGATGTVHIESEAGTDVKLVNPFEIGGVQVNESDGGEVAFTLADGIISFATEPGGTYLVTSGEAPEPTPSTDPSPTPSADPSPTASTDPSPTPSADPSPTANTNPSPRPTASPVIKLTVGENDWQRAREAAQTVEGDPVVTFKIDGETQSGAYAIVLPAATLSGNEAGAIIDVSTPAGRVALPPHMFGIEEVDGGDIEIRLTLLTPEGTPGQAGNGAGSRMQIAAYSGSELLPWGGDRNKAITVWLPFAPKGEAVSNPERIVALQVDEEGGAVAIPNGRYDEQDGSVRFASSALGVFEAVYVDHAFGDTASVEWASRAIGALAARGVVNGVSDARFAPSGDVTRAEFVTMLTRLLELEEQGGEPFADVPDDANALRTARALGIASGNGHNLFRPEDPVSRAEMIALTERALRAAKLIGTEQGTPSADFADRGHIPSYAVESVNRLATLGIIQGDGGRVTPLAWSTRAQAAVLLYNVFRALM